MPLTRVTFTGADDSTSIDELLRRSNAPHAYDIEWGVLYSTKRTGSGRYPTKDWIERLAVATIPGAVGAPLGAGIALHICGREAIDEFLTGRGWTYVVSQLFDRVQLNLRSEHYLIDDIRAAIKRCPIQPVITQHNAANESLMEQLADIRNSVVLFDQSGGRGRAPDTWPGVCENGVPVPTERVSPEFGYAGGLGPDTIASELPRIDAACKLVPHWIDMESSLRDARDRFDLMRVDAVLAILDQMLSPA